MANVSGNLTPCLRRLEWALGSDTAGREREWSQRVQEALTVLSQSLRRHAAESQSQEGPMTEVDLNRPTLARQVAELDREHAVLLDRTLALGRQVQGARDAFGPRRPGPDQSALAIPDFGVLRQEAHELLANVRRHEERETDLVLESVTTDIGVGD